ncbi:MAG: WG repeat-containing protein [Candidatus Kapabacteria bacterium]|nr:WG repeat-containing protein [Candidatus Kapabacteria bacterium]
MKKTIFFALFVLTFLNFDAIAADTTPLVAYKLQGQWHVLDKTGKELLSTSKVMEVLGFSNGYLRVKIKRAVKEIITFMKMDGTIVEIPDVDQVWNFSEGRAVAVKYLDELKTKNLYGFLDENLKIVIPVQYTDATDFHEGLAFLRSDRKRGYINKKGDYEFYLDSLVGYDFSEGIAKVNNEAAFFGFIDKKGKLIINLKFDEVGNFTSGLCYGNNIEKYGYFDTKGQFAIKPIYDYTNNFSEGFAFVGKLDSKFKTNWGIIDTAGKEYGKFEYDKFRDFSDGLAAVLKGDKWGFIDRTSTYIIEPQYTSADSFVEGLAWASEGKANKYGFINKKGIFIVSIPKPDKVVDLRQNRIVN